MTNQFPLISANQQKELYDALHYMKMAELKKACQVLSISDSGKKGELINRIMVYIKTGEIEKPKSIPVKSLAKNHPIQELNKKSLMLYGSYKNDLKTRNFFKSLIGPQFHFTAFGIDWLNERWLNGNPPTYQEFADYWIEENAKRNKQKAEPKKEWAYINFLQRAQKSNPDMSKEELMWWWKKSQAEKAKFAKDLIKKITSA